MKRLFFRLVLGLSGIFALGVSALVLSAVVRPLPRFDAPFPAIRATDDPAVLARGEYLVRGPAHCGDCHAAPGGTTTSTSPLVGGRVFALPVGTFHVPNITPDPETGIGRYDDAELARILRHGVRPDGRAMLPFMPFANLSDEDLRAVLSYIRAQAPVRNVVPAHEVNLLGRVMLAYVVTPKGPTRAIEARAPEGVTAERGEYLVHSVANCASCHTRTSMRTGEPIGPVLAGGQELPSDADPDVVYVSPSLRPDANGRITGRSEDGFVARLGAGRGPEGSHMPWRSFANLAEDDVRAIYRYLQSLPPAGELTVARRGS